MGFEPTISPVQGSRLGPNLATAPQVVTEKQRTDQELGREDMGLHDSAL